MKVCQVINSLSAGGAEVFTCQLAVALAKKGHDVTVVTYQGIRGDKGRSLNQYLLDNGVNVFHHRDFKKGKLGYILAFLYLLKTIFKLRPNVVHAHLQLSDFFILVVRRLLFFRKVKIVRTVHNKRKSSGLPSSFEQRLFKGYDYNVACSDFVQNAYEVKGLRQFLVSIPNGIDLSEANRYLSLEQSTTREKLGLPLGKKIFYNIGSMYLSDDRLSKKNQQFIIDTLELMKDRDDFLCLLIGEGTLRSDFEQSVRDKGLSHCVLFTGNVLNVYEYINSCDFCIMPSLDEGLPIALIEVVCSGKYAITSSIAAFIPFKSDSVQQLKSFDITEFRDSLNYTLNNLEECSRKGGKNIQYFREKFDMNSVADKYLKLYDE